MFNLKKIYFQLLFILSLLVVLILLGFNDNDGDELQVKNKKKGLVDSKFNTKEQLGKLLFFEKSLSTPPGQACADCHSPEVAFADPVIELPVSKGAHLNRYGSRNDMTVSYSSFVPPLHFDKNDSNWVGGLFWDGRVNSLAEQSKEPLLNPLEMANPDTLTILNKLETLNFIDLFTEVYGSDALTDPTTAFNNMADAIEAYENTSEVSPFSSKYDYWLQGKTELSEQEMRGLILYEAEDKGNCAACHPNSILEDGSLPLFTDFTYDNLGVPRNPENPFYSLLPDLNPDGFEFVDLGLGKTLNDPKQNGKFRVPTLRNIGLTSPYMHNGVYKTLFNVLAFYNTRDVANWPEPEVAQNVNMDELGDLRLTNSELEDLVAFLRTLTDGWEDPNY